MRVYADNASTTKVNKDLLDKMYHLSSEIYGNPSSLHSVGRKAKEVLEKARETVAESLNCEPENIIFTHSGSEANNLTLKGRLVIGSNIEHKSVLKNIYFDKSWSMVKANNKGIINPKEVEKRIKNIYKWFCSQNKYDSYNPDFYNDYMYRYIVSVMTVNNELGTINDMRNIINVCHHYGLEVHTDYTQAMGHIYLNTEQFNADYIAISGHKIHAPKGIGVLYARNISSLSPIVLGGGQEKGKIAGTENVIMAFAIAEMIKKYNNKEIIRKNNKRVKELRKLFIDRISVIPDCYINGYKKYHIENIMNISIAGVEAESLMLMLDMKDIYVSSGSACNSKEIAPSHVLTAIENEYPYSTIRISINEENTEEEMVYMADELIKAVDILRKANPNYSN